MNWDKYRWRAAGIVVFVFAIAALAMMAVSKPAKAEGLGTPSSIAGPLSSFGSGTWTGIYAGVGGGYQVSDTELSVPGFSLIDGISGRGWAGDARIGFDWQASGTPFVLGLLGGYNVGEAKSEALGGMVSATLTPSWYVGGRLGFAFPTKTLVYGGAAWQRAEGKLGGLFSGSATDDGIMYIAGIEQVIAPNLTLGVEYSLSQYEFSAGSLAIEPDVHAFKARLNWRPFAK